MFRKSSPVSPALLFTGFVAFFSPLIPPSTRAVWCHHGGRVAIEEQATEVNIFFGVYGRVDELADRLLDLGLDLIDHTWIHSSLSQHRKLDLADYTFSHLSESERALSHLPSPTSPHILAESVPMPFVDVEEPQEESNEDENFPDSVPDTQASLPSPISSDAPAFASRPVANFSYLAKPFIPFKRSLRSSPFSNTPNRLRDCREAVDNLGLSDTDRVAAAEPEQIPDELDETTNENVKEKQNSFVSTDTAKESQAEANEPVSELIKDVKVESEEEISSHALLDSLRSNRSKSPSPSQQNNLEESSFVAAQSPSHSVEDVHTSLTSSALDDFWKTLASNDSTATSTTGRQEPLLVSAADFLDALKPPEASTEQGWEPSKLLNGISLMEHGQNGFKATRKSGAQESPDKKRMKLENNL